MVKRLRRFLIIALAVFSFSFITGCGFHLKGLLLGSSQGTALSIYPVYENTSSAFRLEFQQVLLENALLSVTPKATDTKVTFKKERWQRQSLSVSDKGIPAEYRLRYILSYSFQKLDSEGQFIEKQREISESRDFKSNNSHLLAVDSEQSLLKRQIQQRMSLQVINSLQ